MPICHEQRGTNGRRLFSAALCGEALNMPRNAGALWCATRMVLGVPVALFWALAMTWASARDVPR